MGENKQFLSDKKPIMNIIKINNLIKLLSKDKKTRLTKKNTNPPVIGKSFSIANDLCGENFLSTNNCFFFEIELKNNIEINVNKIT